MSIDLHCHTKISDGSIGIEELIAIAKRRGLSAIAITDHDAVAGATRATIIGKRQGIDVIHGVEFSTEDKTRGRRVHILGYMCDSPDRMEGMCRQITASRREATTQMVRRVLRYYPIVPESVTRCAAGSTAIFKQHIMHALIDAGYADSFYGSVYDKLFGPDGCVRVDMEYPDVRAVIDLIHSAGGLAVLAHPTSYDSEDLMVELAEAGLLDGIEVWHPGHNSDKAAQLADFATQHGLLMTGGSDFHGMYTASPRLLGNLDVPDNTPQLMTSYKIKKYRR